jgi:hypothetical protein
MRRNTPKALTRCLYAGGRARRVLFAGMLAGLLLAGLLVAGPAFVVVVIVVAFMYVPVPLTLGC